MLIYEYFWFIFIRQTQGSVLDLPLSQQEQIWYLNEVIRVEYCTYSLAFELRLHGPIPYRVYALRVTSSFIGTFANTVLTLYSLFSKS